MIRVISIALFGFLICFQINGQNNQSISDTNVFTIEINTLPQLNTFPDSIKLRQKDTLSILDSTELILKKSPPPVKKKKRKKRISKEEQLLKEEKIKWEKVLDQQNRTAIENYLKSSEGTNTYLVEAGKKLEEFKIIKIDTFQFDKWLNYTFEFKGTEDKAPAVASNKLDQITIKERNSNFVIINTDYTFFDTITFLVEGSSWKKIPVFVSKPKLNSTELKEEKGSPINKYLLALVASILALWFFRYLFNDKKPSFTTNENLSIKHELNAANKGIVVESVGKRNHSIKPAHKNHQEKNYQVPLNEYWDDSAIHNCIFEKDFIEELHYFLFGIENKDKVETVELGGFILGSYQQNSSGFYTIHCTKFVGIQSEKEDLYKMGFGSKAWIALEEVMHNDKYKELALIGWFHTHPGHGVFLSKPDLNICNNIFPEPYQFAMVMDTIKTASNEKYHVGLFTKKINGEMNNIKEKKTGFVQWQDVVQTIITF